MVRYILRRLFWLLVAIWVVSTITFILSHIVPSDPARMIAGMGASKAQVDAIRQSLGLDRPLPEQYLTYMVGLLRGDLGQSAVTREPVAKELAIHIPATVELALVSFVVYALLGVTLGILSAVRVGRLETLAIRIGAITGAAVPLFWLGTMGQLIFYYYLGWVPAGGRLPIGVDGPPAVTHLYLIDSLLAGDWELFRQTLRHLIMPVTVLVLGMMATATRLTRATMLEELRKPYIRTAVGKGLAEWKVVLRHAFRNALNPVITMLGLQFAFVLGNTVLVEVVFSWPGIGYYAFRAFTYFDYAPIMAMGLISTFAYVIINLLVDLMYPLLDPRIRLGL